MTGMSPRFAWLAAGLAALAAAAGLFAGVYRDVPPMIDQAQAADFATLCVAVPLLIGALVRGQRIVAAAVLAYLAYTYAIFSFEIVLNPMAPVYIAVLSLSLWSLVPGVRDLASATAGTSLPRRLSAAFLSIVALLFAALWLSEIAGSITSGAQPPSVASLNVPTSAVYALDLGFVLPLFILAAAMIVRRSPGGAALALGSLVFLVLMALSILPMFVIEATRGEPVDPVVPLIFVGIAVTAAVLSGIGIFGRKGSPRPIAEETPAGSTRPARRSARGAGQAAS